MSFVPKIGILLAILLPLSTECFGLPSQDPDLSKGLESTAYANKRRSFAPSGTSGGPAKRRFYRAAKSVQQGTRPKPRPNVRTTEIADIGFTLWKFTPVSDSDDPKILKEPGPGGEGLVAARRMLSDSTLEIGDVVRIGIESGSHPGHLYVINREKYSDGTFGKARLLFPTLAFLRGRNQVQPGLLMFFPQAPSFFEVTSDTPARQNAEEIIVIVAPTEIVDPGRLTLGHLELTDAEVNGWIKKWGVETARLELEGGAGEPMTVAEKAAGDQQKSLSLRPSLTATDAVPQTLYRMRIKKGDPVLARIELLIKPK